MEGEEMTLKKASGKNPLEKRSRKIIPLSFPCGECGMIVTTNARHTLQDCKNYIDRISQPIDDVKERVRKETIAETFQKVSSKIRNIKEMVRKEIVRIDNYPHGDKCMGCNTTWEDLWDIHKRLENFDKEFGKVKK